MHHAGRWQLGLLWQSRRSRHSRAAGHLAGRRKSQSAARRNPAGIASQATFLASRPATALPFRALQSCK